MITYNVTLKMPDGDDNLGFDLSDNRVKMRFQPKDSKSKQIIYNDVLSFKQKLSLTTKTLYFS